ncbi:hypothetical protein BB561_006611 [Smittium simulii]|uniref:SCP domain-containing protein n=1 Tax=Smittium simulii TaxID=133385 RepID=A0A2T9Y2V1_9FUNG|nr:hypothetical protein BB561_006611 [Smittium simulii]
MKIKIVIYLSSVAVFQKLASAWRQDIKMFVDLSKVNINQFINGDTSQPANNTNTDQSDKIPENTNNDLNVDLNNNTSNENNSNENNSNENNSNENNSNDNNSNDNTSNENNSNNNSSNDNSSNDNSSNVNNSNDNNSNNNNPNNNNSDNNTENQQNGNNSGNPYGDITAEDANKLLGITNKIRADNGKSPLVLESSLVKACLFHSKYMAENKVLTHSQPNFSDAGARMKASGAICLGRGCSENAAINNIGVEDVMNMWVKSPVHFQIILTDNHSRMGIANVKGYWTQIFT